MKSDGVHENFFSVPELPHKKREREAILLLKEIIKIIYSQENDGSIVSQLQDLIDTDELFDWIMKYKGE